MVSWDLDHHELSISIRYGKFDSAHLLSNTNIVRSEIGAVHTRQLTDKGKQGDRSTRLIARPQQLTDAARSRRAPRRSTSRASPL